MCTECRLYVYLLYSVSYCVFLRIFRCNVMPFLFSDDLFFFLFLFFFYVSSHVFLGCRTADIYRISLKINVEN